MAGDSSTSGGPRRRRRSARGGRGGGMPPIMWLAVIVCVVGAVFLFRSGGGDIPTGIGEMQTTITAAEVESTLADLGLSLPHSGDVDISEQNRSLTPEKPAGETAKAAAGSPPNGNPGASTATSGTGNATPPPVAPQNKTTKKTATPPTTTVKKPTPRRPPANPAPRITPVEVGPYVVQVGSFGEGENADKEAARLINLGWKARVKVGNTSDGSMIYRVRVGYFSTRADAEGFIRQNRRHLGGAIPAHR